MARYIHVATAGMERSYTGAYCNTQYNKYRHNNTYGRLYNWYSIGDSRNIAPTGWHVASDSEWTVLTTYLLGESVAGGNLKKHA